jgi:cyclopropane fatty-acyl-phospholipid synthase-like methyltransferase
MRMMGRWREPWRQLTTHLQDGRGDEGAAQGHQLEIDEAYLADFIFGMHEFASLTADDVAAVMDLPRGSRILDVGGGAGTYSIALAKRDADAKAMIADLPSVQALATQTAAAAGLGDRLMVTDVDYTVDPFPRGYDVILLSNILHQETRTTAASILKRAREAVDPGGLVVIHTHLLDDDRAGPLFPVLQGLSARLLWRGGGGVTLAEIIDLVTESGMVTLDTRAVASSRTSIVIAAENAPEGDQR